MIEKITNFNYSIIGSHNRIVKMPYSVIAPLQAIRSINYSVLSPQEAVRHLNYHVMPDLGKGQKILTVHYSIEGDHVEQTIIRKNDAD